MISFQIALSNLIPTHPNLPFPTRIQLKFGSISTTLDLIDGRGGKCLFLDISQQQLQNIYTSFACGLFICTDRIKCFSLLNLSTITPGDKIICQGISFSNDQRQIEYRAQVSINCKMYKQPRIANTNKLQNRQQALNMLKKPPLPQMNSGDKKQNKSIKSFLYGKKEVEPVNDHLQTVKDGLRKKSQTKQQLQKMKNQTPNIKKQQKQPPKTNNYLNDTNNHLNDTDPFDLNPPPMEFTNDQAQIYQPSMTVPQVQNIQIQSQPTQPRFKFQTPNVDPPTFNRNGNRLPSESIQTPTAFEINKKDSRKSGQNKALTRNQIQKMAIQEAQAHKPKDNIMIPILKGNGYEMVPLSSLKPQEIVEYVQRQRKIQEQMQLGQKKREKLARQQKQLNEQKKKLAVQIQKMQKRERQKMIEDALPSKPSTIKRKSITPSIKQQQQSQKAQEYDDDFQSLSGTGSMIRQSRISSKRNSKHKQDQSVQDYQAQFDSYIHSSVNKSQSQNRNPTHSYQDYSQSFASYSQSFRK